MNQIVELKKTIEYIENNLLDDINFESIAKEVGMSSYYFHRMFSYIVGVSVTEYIWNRRLSLAADELSKNKSNILDIALKYKYGIGRILENNDKGFKDGEIIKVKKSKWIVFSLKGQKPDDINILWKKIYKEYFPTSEYKQSMPIDFEFYDDKNTEIWIPIE